MQGELDGDYIKLFILLDRWRCGEITLAEVSLNQPCMNLTSCTTIRFIKSINGAKDLLLADVNADVSRYSCFFPFFKIA